MASQEIKRKNPFKIKGTMKQLQKKKVNRKNSMVKGMKKVTLIDQDELTNDDF